MKNSRFKKIFITIFLSLVMIFSSFASVFATTSMYIASPNPTAPVQIDVNVGADWKAYTSDGRVIFSTWHQSTYNDYLYSFTDSTYIQTYISDMLPHSYPSGAVPITYPVFLTNGTTFIPYTSDTTLPVYNIDYTKTVTIKAGQQINFQYTDANKLSFLKSIDTNDGCIMNGTYSINGTFNNSTPSIIGGDYQQLTDSFWDRIDLTDFAPPRTLSTGEFYNLLVMGSTKWTSSENQATISFDQTKCKYSITSITTGLVADPGTLTNADGTPIIADDAIGSFIDPNANNNGIKRSDYQDGIVGDVEYQFAVLFSFIRLPFTILYSFFLSLGEILTYALGSVGALLAALTSLYGILPTTISALLSTAVTISIFKVIFGR